MANPADSTTASPSVSPDVQAPKGPEIPRQISPAEERKLRWQMRFMRFKMFFAKIGQKIRNIRFTKAHLRLWGDVLLLNTAFAAKGLIGLITLGLVDLEITGVPSRRVAVSSAVLREIKEKELKETEEYKSGDYAIVGNSTSIAEGRSSVAGETDEDMDAWIAKMRGDSVE